jgi:hypothetical protein
MDSLVIIEGISTILAFILVWFTIKPYKTFEDSRYLSLPIGFTLLGFSYIFMGASLIFQTASSVERAKWMHLFTGAYAFAFLAVTYYFEAKRPGKETSTQVQALISLSLISLTFLVAVLFFPPLLEIPDYKTADEYFRLFNMSMALYIVYRTLRSHVATPEPATILAPLGFALLAFSQYSLLIWSIDSSLSAFLGAHVLRIFSLLIFMYIALAPVAAQRHSTRVEER